MTVLKFEELTIGLKVKDSDGDIAVIEECSDIHNISVVYEVGGAGFYCLDETCDTYEPLYKI